MHQLPEDERIELYLGRVIMPRLAKIEGGLELLNLNLLNLGKQMQCEWEDQEEINKKVEKHELIFNGNGKKGLVSWVEDFKEWIDDEKKFRWFMRTSVITTAIGLIVTIVMMLLKIK